MDPGEAAVGAPQVIELGLLAYPENAQDHEAHHVHQQAGREAEKGVPEIMFAVDRFRSWGAKIECEQGHRDREDAVAQGGEALGAVARDPVVVGRYRVGFIVYLAAERFSRQRCARMVVATRSMGGSSSILTLVLGMVPSSARLGATHDHTSNSLR